MSRPKSGSGDRKLQTYGDEKPSGDFCLFDVPLLVTVAGITPILVPEFPEGFQFLQVGMDGASVLVDLAIIDEDGGTLPFG